MKWLVQRYQPLSTVECPDFRHMINCANPRIQLPSTRLFKERLLTWKLKLERILEEMTKDEVEACTSDSWTSVSNESYTSLTRHFVDRYWELLSLPIDCVKHEGTTTASDIANTIVTMVEAHKINCINITTDCEPSQVAAARDLPFAHSGCIDHRIEIITGIVFEGKGKWF
jgi:hypothetical protein